jgi:hypothetical protein
LFWPLPPALERVAFVLRALLGGCQCGRHVYHEVSTKQSLSQRAAAPLRITRTKFVVNPAILPSAETIAALTTVTSRSGAQVFDEDRRSTRRGDSAILRVPRGPCAVQWLHRCAGEISARFRLQSKMGVARLRKLVGCRANCRVTDPTRWGTATLNSHD